MTKAVNPHSPLLPIGDFRIRLVVELELVWRDKRGKHSRRIALGRRKSRPKAGGEQPHERNKFSDDEASAVKEHRTPSDVFSGQASRAEAHLPEFGKKVAPASSSPGWTSDGGTSARRSSGTRCQPRAELNRRRPINCERLPNVWMSPVLHSASSAMDDWRLKPRTGTVSIPGQSVAHCRRSAGA